MVKHQQVWVAYAHPEAQFLIAVEFTEGMTVRDAIEQSRIRNKIDLPEVLQTGIFGIKVTEMSQPLQAGDRVEIYRPLTVNPKETRRKRAEKNPVGRYAKSNRLRQLK
ncbi:RnfH family protein [Acinetobacter radioresistens]|uniref:RnfH family protein n=1 Tax=Acinetobacter radioresistens TaxID=40216 RepID=UPI0034D4AC51